MWFCIGLIVGLIIGFVVGFLLAMPKNVWPG